MHGRWSESLSRHRHRNRHARVPSPTREGVATRRAEGGRYPFARVPPRDPRQGTERPDGVTTSRPRSPANGLGRRHFGTVVHTPGVPVRRPSCSPTPSPSGSPRAGGTWTRHPSPARPDQGTAVGSRRSPAASQRARAEPGSRPLAPRERGRADARAFRQSDSAHHTEHVTVHYPWHPLHGQTLSVRRTRPGESRALAVRSRPAHGRDSYLDDGSRGVCRAVRGPGSSSPSTP